MWQNKYIEEESKLKYSEEVWTQGEDAKKKNTHTHTSQKGQQFRGGWRPREGEEGKREDLLDGIEELGE